VRPLCPQETRLGSPEREALVSARDPARLWLLAVALLRGKAPSFGRRAGNAVEGLRTQLGACAGCLQHWLTLLCCMGAELCTSH
jgi:hypothetical protein